MHNREGAFSIYDKETPLELVGYTSCGGCLGGNIEYVPEEMVKNGVEVIHLAIGMVVGYPPCPRTIIFKNFIEEKYIVKVIIGTHPIPEKYHTTHQNLKTWEAPSWDKITAAVMSTPEQRKAYNLKF